MSGYDSVNRNVLTQVRKVARDGADITSGSRQFHTWGLQLKMLGYQQWSSEPEAGWGICCKKSEILGDLEGRKRRWMDRGMTVHSGGGPCVPGRQQFCQWKFCFCLGAKLFKSQSDLGQDLLQKWLNFSVFKALHFEMQDITRSTILTYLP